MLNIIRIVSRSPLTARILKISFCYLTFIVMVLFRHAVEVVPLFKQPFRHLSLLIPSSSRLYEACTPGPPLVRVVPKSLLELLALKPLELMRNKFCSARGRTFAALEIVYSSSPRRLSSCPCSFYDASV
ncbi:hypothetical protein SLA2020_078860 [Shorea laevis]